MNIVVDCRYTRIGHHDGISRYGARLVEALALRAMPGGDQVTMLISDERQLSMLPDLPWHRVSGPTSAREPWVAHQVNRLRPDVGEHRGRVVQGRLDQPRPGRDGVAVPGRQVVEHRDLVAALEQRGRDYAADVAGPTGDENAHGPTLGRTTVVVRARPAVQALPAYKPGRNPADVAREIGVERAVKLASNEVAFPPLPAVVQALATAAAETNRYPDNGAVVLTARLAEHYGVDPGQVVTGCGASTKLRP